MLNLGDSLPPLKQQHPPRNSPSPYLRYHGKRNESSPKEYESKQQLKLDRTVVPQAEAKRKAETTRFHVVSPNKDFQQQNIKKIQQIQKKTTFKRLLLKQNQLVKDLTRTPRIQEYTPQCEITTELSRRRRVLQDAENRAKTEVLRKESVIQQQTQVRRPEGNPQYFKYQQIIVQMRFQQIRRDTLNRAVFLASDEHACVPNAVLARVRQFLQYNPFLPENRFMTVAMAELMLQVDCNPLVSRKILRRLLAAHCSAEISVHSLKLLSKCVNSVAIFRKRVQSTGDNNLTFRYAYLLARMQLQTINRAVLRRMLELCECGGQIELSDYRNIISVVQQYKTGIESFATAENNKGECPVKFANLLLQMRFPQLGRRRIREMTQINARCRLLKAQDLHGIEAILCQLGQISSILRGRK